MENFSVQSENTYHTDTVPPFCCLIHNSFHLRSRSVIRAYVHICTDTYMYVQVSTDTIHNIVIYNQKVFGFQSRKSLSRDSMIG